ncbi:multi-sensor signal transduction multi-kinase [Nitzschia inconspicua]|uniref:Multi-sensor signal transduction multi-kinase n=1 Tax=Nitzschia inconspicua TaxID=303405 RepID=A0A9K3LC28_9STRA|nr:multi-sensor signal transduction multi-kinase [Nitzschia inconspicua]
MPTTSSSRTNGPGTSSGDASSAVDPSISDVTSSFLESASSGTAEPSGSSHGHHLSKKDEHGLIMARHASLPFMPLARRANDLSELTINKLNFQKLQLYGRETHTATLQRAWHDMKSIARRREYISISGPSGVGKTKLVQELYQYSGLVVQGKFDSHQERSQQDTSATSLSEPYAGISRAYADICGAIVGLETISHKVSQDIRNKISVALGPELALLSRFIPALSEVIAINNNSTFTTEEAKDMDHSLNAEESTHQITFAFQRFVQVVSQEFDPLIIIVDDLHWADSTSLDLLQALLEDETIPKLLLVGVHRSEQLEVSQVLKRHLSKVKSKAGPSTFHFQTISVDNLEVPDIQRMLKDLLSMDSKCEDGEYESRVESLARLCKNKTLGNTFYLIQYLSSLQDNHLLTFNFGDMKWHWDEEAIQLQTNTTDNVIQLLQSHMNCLESQCIQVLKLAACLGSIVRYDCLKILWQEFQDITTVNQDAEALESLLQKLELHGFLVPLTKYSEEQSYAWAHDKIQDAAFSLIPKDDLPSFSRQAGEILLSKLNSNQIESSIFVVVNLLNAADAPDNSDDTKDHHDNIINHTHTTLAPLEVAQWNRVATQKAVAISAYESAAVYAAYGIRRLPDDKWSTAYDLSFDLYLLGAKAEGYLGHAEVMGRYCQEILEQDIGSDVDKLRAYNVMVDSMVFRCQIDDAIALMLRVFKRFGCTTPTGSLAIGISIIKGILNTKRIIKHRSITSLQKMNDPIREELVELMKRLNMCFYVNGDMRYALTGFRCVEWATKYGVCGVSSVGFAQAGVVMVAAAGDYKNASLYAKKATEIVDLTRSERFRANVLMLAYGFLHPWTRPLRSCLSPLHQSYKVGLRLGDTESATVSILHYTIFKFMCGGNLDSMAEESTLFTRQMKSLDRIIVYKLNRILLQVFYNLLGHDNLDEPTRLVGIALPEEDAAEEAAGKEPMLWAAHVTFGGILKTYFGKHQSAADDVLKHGPNKVTSIFAASHTGVLDTYLKCVSCFAAARSTKRRKYAAVGKKLRSKIKTWSKAGNPNVIRYELLVDAELLAWKGKHQEAIKLYEDVIRTNVRGGCQNDAALACERLADLYAHHMKNRDDDARYRLNQARRCWDDWGAKAKVMQMDDFYGSIEGGLESAFFHESLLFSTSVKGENSRAFDSSYFSS